MKLKTCWLAAVVSATALSAQAAENGNTQYSPGSAQFFAGGMPPFPGFYFVSQISYYSADRTNDSNGDRIPIDFKVKALAETSRFLYISDINIAGADVWGQLVVPVVHLDMSLPFGHDKSTALADIIVSGGLAWHPDRYNTFVAGLDIAMPTGSYDVSELANIGTNHWSVQPTVAYHYTDPEGFEFGGVARVIFNTENTDTDYTSGNELVIDYALGWNFDKLRVGAVGYYLQQLTDDSGPTAPADGKRGKGFAVGPSLTYSFNPGMQLGVSWQHDVVAENRSQGDIFWVNFATKF
ncbi:transporter [Rhizobium skierniewicense]|uniref:SphA family protein n=1 Tax=Rhizobium skierniewicense TaxID=984260 RepID=UPI001FACE9B0|nr:transporter [Rhizobium skierniewicense]MCI9868370.1 transporter [Rhizobium skierniewicense]